ncbi:MAG TPA: adenylate/guanylate cyclase domain-containing protein [Alphaproteobacteria bacterium]|nr:adenylate/guanylate cyclase domain-containing protein [Alphaproteobacteria bacterium]
MIRGKRRLGRHMHWLLPLAILLLAVAGWLSEPPALAQLRFLVFDSFYRLKPRPYTPLPVRIVDLDDESLARLGQWPWPRTLVAKLVDRLDALGAAAIAFDIVFAEPDRTSPRRLAETWEGLPPDDPLVARLKSLPDNDEMLAAALRRAKAVTGFVLTEQPGGRAPAAKASFATLGDDPRAFVPRFAGAVVSLPALEAAASGNGSINNTPDLDGKTRRVPLVVAFGGKLYPSLAAEALRVAQGARTDIIKSTGASGVVSFGEHTGVNAVKIGDFVVPTDAAGEVWVHFTRHAAARFVPAWRVFQPDFDANLIKGNIVFVGTSAAGLNDLRATPLDPAAAGVEVHAQVVEQILLGDSLRRPDWARGAELVYMLVIGLVLIIGLPKVGAQWMAAVGGAAMAAAIGGSFYAYAALRFLLDPVYPSVVVLLVYLSSSAVLFLQTEVERRRVRTAFSRYLAPALVEHLADNPERLVLGGEMREMTLLFCDIRGFTTISERFDAHGLTRFINSFLTPMTNLILAADGTIDKYMGDAIMAFWNAPIAIPDHATRACRAALAMRAELVRLNATWRREAEAEGRGFEEVHIGIGLNTGVCCVGNMGSDQRFDYSVLGDDVNLASRLEGQSKTYGVDIVIGERTAAEAPALATLELDLIRVKGKTRPVRIFGLIGDEGIKENPTFVALAGEHAALIAAYRGRRWAEAREHLRACTAQAPAMLQSFYELYEARIAACETDPPPVDWDGVFVALTK